jgi:polyphosphate glucokinase
MLHGPLTLAIDIGGTGLKVGVLDADGNVIEPHVRIDTPKKGTPEQVLEALLGMIQPLGTFDRISVGFPGVVRANHVMTAPNLANAAWRDYPLAAALTDRLGKPVRMLNDATVHGLGVVTGFGFALFDKGSLTPHLELAHHPIRNDKDYDQYIGDAALRKIGRKRWNKRLAFALSCVRGLTGYDLLHIGGGNARHIRLELEQNVRIVPNEAGIVGGVRLWDPRLDPYFAMG